GHAVKPVVNRGVLFQIAGQVIQQLAASRQSLLPLGALIRGQTVFRDDLEVFAEQNFRRRLQRLSARGGCGGVVVSEQPLIGGFDSTVYLFGHALRHVNRVSREGQDSPLHLFNLDPLMIVIVHGQQHLHVIEQQGERRIGRFEDL